MSDIPPPQPTRDAEPFRGFAHAMLNKLSAQAVAVWLCNGVPGTFSCVTSLGANGVDPFQMPLVHQQLSGLLLETITAGQERAVNVTGLGNVGL